MLLFLPSEKNPVYSSSEVFLNSASEVSLSSLPWNPLRSEPCFRPPWILTWIDVKAAMWFSTGRPFPVFVDSCPGLPEPKSVHLSLVSLSNYEVSVDTCCLPGTFTIWLQSTLPDAVPTPFLVIHSKISTMLLNYKASVYLGTWALLYIFIFAPRLLLSSLPSVPCLGNSSISFIHQTWHQLVKPFLNTQDCVLRCPKLHSAKTFSVWMLNCNKLFQLLGEVLQDQGLPCLTQ